MAVLAKLDGGFGTERRIAALGSAAARLLRAYATRKLRFFDGCVMADQQVVRVEHVHVNDGGQAVIGNVRKSLRSSNFRGPFLNIGWCREKGSRSFLDRTR
jgi:hypothetical protein